MVMGNQNVVVVNEAGNSVSVFRNTSTTGSISFAAKFDVPAGSGPGAVALADVDGDGKPDLLVAAMGSTGWVSIYHNTSTSGSISFSSNVDFATGINPEGIAFADIDGDGKSDLIVSCGGYTNNVGVFRNTSTIGSITSGSFASRVDLSPGSGPFMLVVADVDGDGKPDIVALNSYSNTISVFRNMNTAGSISAGSFASKVTFNTGSYPYGIAVADVDGDGKPDIVVANSFGHTLSVFHNTSTSGSITSGSFATKIDFPTGISPQEVAICDLDGDGKPDLVVTNDSSNTISVFRNTVANIATITSFSPTSGPIGTSVTITGTNFNTTAIANKVYFGAVAAKVNSSTSTSLTVKVPLGATYASISVTDTTSGLTAYSSAPFVVTFPSSQAIDTTSFASKVDFTTDAGPVLVAICDVDADGKPDLVVTDAGAGNGNTISVFKNTSTSGSMTAGSFASKVDFTTGSYPVHVVIGDVDGDGKPDIVLANVNSNTVSVFRNTSASGSITAGSFAPKVDFTTGTAPWGVAIGDMDGDGKPDIIVTNGGSSGSGTTVSVFRNTSTLGSITAGSFASKVDFTTGTYPTDVAICDLDEDGKPDIVVVNLNSNSISVLRNTSTPGSITTSSFAPKVDFTTGSNPYRVAIADVDGDGKPDIVVTNSGNGVGTTVSVFRNTGTSGSITASSFAPKVDFTTGLCPFGLAITDLDGDGKVDIVVANHFSNTVSILRNTSASGSITASSFAPKVDFATGSYPNGVAIADVDGDGKPDLVVVNSGSNTLSVFRNVISGAPPTISSFSPTSGPIGTAVTITGTNFNATASNNIVYFGAVKAPVSTASSTQLTVTVPVGATYAPITVTDTTSGLTAFSSAPFVVTFPSSRIIDTTSFAPGIGFTTGTGPGGIAVCDLDGDGKPDLVVTNTGGGGGATISVFRNTSTPGSISAGSFAPGTPLTTGAYPLSVANCDLDGDGKPDIVVVNNNSNTLSVFRNTSTPGNISFQSPIVIPTASGPARIAIGDLDGDGKPDLVVTNIDGGNADGNTVSVFRNTSTLGNISFAPKVDFTTGGTNPEGVAICDLDGDGRPDLVVVVGHSDSINVFRNTSTPGSITAKSFAPEVSFSTGLYPLFLAVGDIDGDGKPDIVVTNSSGPGNGVSNTISVFRNTSTPGSITTSSLASKVDFTTGIYPYAVAMADVDGDGKPDILVTSSYDTLSVFRNTSAPGSISASSFAPRVDFTTGSEPGSIVIGDVDGDGKPDIIVVTPNNNTVSVLRNTIPGSLSAPILASPANGSTGISTNPTLIWNVSTGAASYRLQVSTDSMFSTTTYDTSGLTATAKSINGLLYQRKYYWRVNATGGAGTSGWSTIWNFTTGASSPVTVTSPNGGENWQVGSAQNITWTSSNVTNVKIEYTTDNGSSWNTIVGSTPASAGSYGWTVPNTPSSQCLVRISDASNAAVSDGSDNTFVIFVYVTSIQLSYTIVFGGTNDISNYQIIGLPGSADLPLANVLSGTQPYDWNAYWDNGNAQNYQIQYDQSNTFDFTPGRAFWILSKNPLSVSQSVPPVALGASAAYSISLHDGWNLISNPFEVSVLWSHVQIANMGVQPIFSFDKTYSQPATFDPYTGYYFFNAGNLPSLKIPYPVSRAFPKLSPGVQHPGAIKNNEVRLDLLQNDKVISTAIVKYDACASVSYDTSDIFSPPGDFEAAGISICEGAMEGAYKYLLLDAKPMTGTGDVTEFKVKNITGKSLSLRPTIGDQFFDKEIYLIDKRLNSGINLRTNSSIRIAPQYVRSDYQLAVGQAGYIDKLLAGLHPTSFQVYQNSPNPFNPTTSIRFAVPSQSYVRVEIFNSIGELIQLLTNQVLPTGIYEYEWNAGGFASGCYFYRVTAVPDNGSKPFVNTRKMLLLR